MPNLNYPPSLDTDVLKRSFVASNGEVGVLPNDADSFLNACEHDDIALAGWELWVVGYACTPTGLVEASGRWAGLIPLCNSEVPAVFHGETQSEHGNDWKTYVCSSIVEIKQQLSLLRLSEEVDAKYLSSIRINFTLEQFVT
ncbi:MAG: hypothetical protein EHM45_08510 [Desulfobacteraceae bacterium]|nr:MAG: hypothetical protein EHM45_08510 [Desulfobacteraceae bacterium]